MTISFATLAFRPWRWLAASASGEWLLTKLHIPNGGAAVLFRSLFTSLVLFIGVLGFINVIDPERSWEFSQLELRIQVLNKFHWFAALFAAIYTALYARFASQWTYLADLYNRIKEAESGGATPSVIAEWKAAFLEDAENLHLVGKTTFVSTADIWGNDSDVRQCFIQNASGGATRYERLMSKIQESHRLVSEKFG